MSAPTTDRGGIQQTIRALVAAGYELNTVHDGDWYPVEAGVTDEDGDLLVRTEPEAIDAIMAVDVAQLYVKKDSKLSWVQFVMGNCPDEVVCDYTTDLEDALGPMFDRWNAEAAS